MLTKILILVTLSSASYGEIVRPCDFENIKCIRDNLVANSRCSPTVEGSLPFEYSLDYFLFDTPFFNATYVDKNLFIRNHDKCIVSEFFFNTEKDTSVLALDCYYLDFESDRTLIQHASLQEDKEYNYHIHTTYPLIRLTTNLRHADKLDLCNSFTFADVTTLPIIHINPKDKPTKNFLSRDLTFLNIYERETFYFRAPQLARTFINSVICNFGCEK